MKKLLLTLVVLSFLAQATSKERFRNLTVQDIGPGFSGRQIQAWHDEESGVEFICVFGEDSHTPSCFLTGRNWKEQK